MSSPFVRVRLAVAVLALCFALVLVSVGAALAQSPATTQAAPQDLYLGSLQSIDSLNPYVGINDPSYVLYGLLYDYLFSLDQDGNLVPNLAVSAACDAVCMNWTYQIRQGVLWSDGSLLTAADVAFTINYDSQNLASLFAYELYMNQVVVCTSATRPYCGAVVTSPWNVTVYFQRPFVAGKSLFVPIVQQAQWSGITPACAQGSAQCGNPFQNAMPIGTGPFIADPNIYTEFLNQFNAGVYIHVARNPNYHPVGGHLGPANLQNIYIAIFQDPNILAIQMLSGAIQLAQFTPATIGVVSNQPNILVQSALQSIQTFNEIGVSQIDTSSADRLLNPARWDVNVRLAMAMATNKDYIIQQFYNDQAARGTGLMSPITPQWWFDPVATGVNLTFDVSAANALLNESGYTTWTGGSFGLGYRQATNPISVVIQPACFQCVSPPNATKTIPAGTTLTFTLATRPTSDHPEEYATALYLQAQYARIGINLVVKPEMTESLLANDVYGGNVEMYIWFWSGDPDPNYLLSIESSWTLDGWNDNYWNSAAYNHLYLAQLADQNLTNRIGDVRAAQLYNYLSAAYIIYAYPYGEWAMRTDVFQNWGDWAAHPYRQLVSFWGANPLFLELGTPVVNNPPSTPVIQGTSPLFVQPNQVVAFVGNSTDPDPNEVLTWTWNWGDNSQTVLTTTSAAHGVTTNHSWAKPGIYTILLSVSDGQLSATSAGFTVDALGVAVSNALGRPGQSVSLSGTIVETAKGKWTFSFGDGSTAAGTFPAGATVLSLTHVYAAQGTYTATLTAKSGSTLQSASGIVTIDGTPPTIQTPSGLVVSATGNLTPVYFTVTATDDFGNVTSLACAPASGSLFPLGTTLVTCQATDLAGNVGTANFTVTVRDVSPPTVIVPIAVFAEATSPAGAYVTFNVSATDNVAVASGPNCTPPSGSLFPIGTSQVSCTATDTSGNVGYGNFTVTVADTIPPVTNITQATDGNGYVIQPGGVTPSRAMTFQFVAHDAVGVVGYVCALDGFNSTACASPIAYSGLAVGQHTFRVAGIDAAGNRQFVTFTWTVLSPSETVQDLVARVNALQAAGKLTGKQANALLAPLNKAYTDLLAGKVSFAIKDLKTFRTLVNQDVTAGILLPADAQPLSDESADLILVLGGTP